MAHIQKYLEGSVLMSVIYLEMYQKLMDGKLCIKASVVTCS